MNKLNMIMIANAIATDVARTEPWRNLPASQVDALVDCIIASVHQRLREYISEDLTSEDYASRNTHNICL